MLHIIDAFDMSVCLINTIASLEDRWVFRKYYSLAANLHDARAMFTIHIHYGFSSNKTIGLTPQGPLFGPPGYQINLLYIVGLISLILTGAGVFLIDELEYIATNL